MSQAETSERIFTIEESFYKEHIKPTISGSFVPDSLIHFTFSLPFQLPLKDGTVFYLVYNDNAYFFHLDKFGDSDQEPVGSGEKTLNLIKLRTRVEAVTVSKDNFFSLDGQWIHSHLVHSLNRLNPFINAYRVLFEDWKTRPVTAENLHSIIWHRIIKIEGWKTLAGGPIMVNENHENIISNLDEQHTEVVHNLGAYLINGKNPFSVPHLHFADARTHLFNGFYRESILSSQMAVESTIRLIYQKSLEQAGRSEPDIQRLLEETPFMQLIKIEMPRILGDAWNVKDGSHVVGKWYQIVYKKRNAIIHAGYTPYGHEAKECFVIAHDLLTHINKRIESKKIQYPDLFKACQCLPKYFLRGEKIGFFGVE